MKEACALIEIPVRRDARGALAFAEVGKQLPFAARREFHLFELQAGVARGGHAHRACHQFMIAMAGQFTVTTDDGAEVRSWDLLRPSQGLHVPPGHWVELTPAADGAVLSVLASHGYDEDDYIRDHARFLLHVHSS